MPLLLTLAPVWQPSMLRPADGEVFAINLQPPTLLNPLVTNEVWCWCHSAGAAVTVAWSLI